MYAALCYHLHEVSGCAQMVVAALRSYCKLDSHFVCRSLVCALASALPAWSDTPATGAVPLNIIDVLWVDLRA